MKAYLRYQDDSLDEATSFSSVASAVNHFRKTASSLLRFGQTIEASIHIAPNYESIVECPDYVLSVGPRGGLKKERA